MTGMDMSPQMLDFAQETALKEGVRSEYILGDITKTRLPARFDFATAVNDCVNYIPKNRLNSALKNIKGALVKGGIFLFDISSERKIRQKIANTVCADDREDITYLSFNKQEEDGVTMEVTLFVKDGDGKFNRFDETHRQYIYTEEEVCEALKANGFEVIDICGHLGEDKAESDRLCILAQKR